MNVAIVAGYGSIVNIVWKEMRKKGLDPLIIDIVGRKYPKEIKKIELKSIDINSFLNVLGDYNINTLALVGKVDKKKILKDLSPYLKERYPHIEKGDLNLLVELENLLRSSKIHILDLKEYITPYIVENKIYTKGEVSIEEWRNIYFGAKRAKVLSDFEIGQTVVVKDMNIYAVEAIEGTNECIKRAGFLGGEEGFVVKVGRTEQQFYLEIPVVGLNTVKSAVEANMRVLAIEAGKTLFLEQEESIEIANKYNLKITGFSLETKP